MTILDPSDDGWMEFGRSAVGAHFSPSNRNKFLIDHLKEKTIIGIPWPRGFVVSTNRAWVRVPVVVLVKTLYHNYFVLRMGHKATGPVYCKRTSWKSGQFNPSGVCVLGLASYTSPKLQYLDIFKF